MIKQKVITRAYIPKVVAHMDTIDDGFIRPDELAGPLKHESFYDFINRVSEEANKVNTLSISYINENTAIIAYDTRSNSEIVNEAINVQEILNDVANHIKPKNTDICEEYYSCDYDVKVIKLKQYELTDEDRLNDDCALVETNYDFINRVYDFINSHDTTDVKHMGDKAVIIYRK